jgi:glycerate dehydrogenase
LESGEIAGAALDVLSKEPVLPTNPLLRIKDRGKLIITPHIAWASVEARKRLMDEIYKGVEEYVLTGR